MAQGKIAAAWGDEAPEWVMALALACDDTSQSRVARLVGYSAGAINSVLANKYNASMDGIERAVRATVMAEVVTCPVLGELPMEDCGKWQGRVENFVGVNSLHVRMFRSCPKCPHFRGVK